MLRKTLRKIIGQNLIISRRFANQRIWFSAVEHLGLVVRSTYEPDVWKKVEDHLPSNLQTILDIGANIGQSALILHDLFPNSKIISYEPSQRPYAFLSLNIFLNNLPVIPVNKGVSCYDKFYLMDYDVITGGRSSQILTEEFDKISISNYREIEVVSLLSQIEKFKPDFIKVDIEGHEKTLFDSMEISILDKIYLLIEVRKDTSKKIISLFLSSHNIYHIEKGKVIESEEAIEFANLLMTPKVL